MSSKPAWALGQARSFNIKNEKFRILLIPVPVIPPLVFLSSVWKVPCVGVYASEHVHVLTVCACIGQRLVLGDFLSYSPHYFLRRDLSLNLSSQFQLDQLTNEPWGSCLFSQRYTHTHTHTYFSSSSLQMSLWMHIAISGFYMVAGDSNSGPHNCKVITLPSSPPHAPTNIFFKRLGL